ncbi:hypothetical protein CMQ_4934 [Grosmannia clavigera kw1407]|uniref:Uncharacterized protein n=1 Tax=Grosmannia clavigera (strain kw1407 / UAMH 11150) TaxID=655863 RepID=F0XK16_GROCL|nr:uncharacterized protein CMQ_4934 [Grosmannia clavigera kw1407]EFX01863.1 hypothetical protein CMQ_4934 [Grosmannia clavigera kw1407]
MAVVANHLHTHLKIVVPVVIPALKAVGQALVCQIPLDLLSVVCCPQAGLHFVPADVPLPLRLALPDSIIPPALPDRIAVMVCLASWAQRPALVQRGHAVVSGGFVATGGKCGFSSVAAPVRVVDAAAHWDDV